MRCAFGKRNQFFFKKIYIPQLKSHLNQIIELAGVNLQQRKQSKEAFWKLLSRARVTSTVHDTATNPEETNIISFCLDFSRKNRQARICNRLA